VREQVALVYNHPFPSPYDNIGEEKAELGVMDAVEAVYQALQELGYSLTRVPLKPPAKLVQKKLRSLKADLVFNLFEGFAGSPQTEALVPQILSEAGIPFTGCPAPAISLSLDKAKAKTVLQGAGIRTPDFQLLNLGTLHSFHLNFPCIVKVCAEHASHGLSPQSVVYDLDSLQRQVGVVSKSFGDNVLVEEFVGGREFNATVLGTSKHIVLPLSEIVFSLPPGMPNILTFASKWEPESVYFQGTRAVCPAEVTKEEQALISETVLAVFRLFGCRGYGRVDMRMDEQNRLYVIEVNPNPDISPDLSGAVRQAEAAGMNYTQFIEKIVQMTLEDNSHGNQGSPHDQAGQTWLDDHIADHTRIQAV
jgi:D-alanine-D-alanine ligase